MVNTLSARHLPGNLLANFSSTSLIKESPNQKHTLPIKGGGAVAKGGGADGGSPHMLVADSSVAYLGSNESVQQV